MVLCCLDGTLSMNGENQKKIYLLSEGRLKGKNLSTAKIETLCNRIPLKRRQLLIQ